MISWLPHTAVLVSVLTQKSAHTAACRNGLIAINYAARGAGVTRHMKVQEAKKVCPGLVAVHVEVLGARAQARAHAPTTSPHVDGLHWRLFRACIEALGFFWHVVIRPSSLATHACAACECSVLSDRHTKGTFVALEQASRSGRDADEHGTVDEKLVEDALREGNHATEAGSSNKGKACLER